MSHPWRPILLGLSLLLLSAPPALAETAGSAKVQPDGWGGAKFRMSVDQVRKILPEATVIGDSGEVGVRDGLSSLPRFVELRLENQTVHGLPGCQVTLKFAADQMYFIEFVCAQAGDVSPVLQQAFGDPHFFFLDADYWRADGIGVSNRRADPVFSYFDWELDQIVQATLKKALIEQSLRKAAQNAAAEPEAAAAP